MSRAPLWRRPATRRTCTLDEAVLSRQAATTSSKSTPERVARNASLASTSESQKPARSGGVPAPHQPRGFPDPEEDDLYWHDKANVAVACLPHVWTHFVMHRFDEKDLQFFLDGLQLPMERPRHLPLVDASAEVSSSGLDEEPFC